MKGPGIQFFRNEKQRSGVVHAFRLPPAPANHAYQVWAIVDGRPASVKVFKSDADGHALVEGLPMPTTPHGVTLIAVTVEPAGGSSQPTTEPFLKGSVPAVYRSSHDPYRLRLALLKRRGQHHCPLLFTSFLHSYERNRHLRLARVDGPPLLRQRRRFTRASPGGERRSSMGRSTTPCGRSGRRRSAD